jgi:hypothetical protein
MGGLAAGGKKVEMPPAWSTRVQRILIVSLATSMLSVSQTWAQGTQPAPGVPAGTEQENPPDTRPGPPFELEPGYELRNLASGI